MLRILRFSTHRPLSADDAHGAFAIAREAAAAAERIHGIRSCTPYVDPEIVVLTAECDCCRDAEDALADPGVQAVIGRLGAEFGYMMCEDEFLLEPQRLAWFSGTG